MDVLCGAAAVMMESPLFYLFYRQRQLELLFLYTPFTSDTSSQTFAAA
jgi:hypothetical protein